MDQDFREKDSSSSTDLELPQEHKVAKNADEQPSRNNNGDVDFTLDNDSSTSDLEIEWQYLTFETPLPTPAYLSQTSSPLQRTAEPPACPDLKKYSNPFEWSPRRKYFMTYMSCIATTCTSFAAGSYSLGIPQMMREWHVSEVAALVGITTFTCGFGAFPMFLAPLSEINGRRPIFVVTGCLYVAFQLTCALTPTFPGMLVARFLVGGMGSTFATMVGGVIADIYVARDRNWAMALYAGGALFGTGLGPVVSGFLAQHTTWRWIFYLQVITCGIVQVFICAFFLETRGSVLLSRRAKTLNKWYDDLESKGYYGMIMPSSSTTDTPMSEKSQQNPRVQRIRWKVKADEERASILVMIGISLYRPFHLLVTEPTVFFFSLWASFAWGVLYLTFSALSLVFTTHFDFNTEEIGGVYASMCVGTILSTAIAINQEKIVKKVLPDRLAGFVHTPEGRLCATCVQSALLPIGLFWFAWTSFRGIPWIVPVLAIGCATMGIYSIYLAVFNYLADIYGRYASSALAAQSFCRNMLAGAFPLFTDQMFRKMTYQGAGSFLGGMAALLTIVPWVLVFYGPRIRARSRFARELMETG